MTKTSDATKLAVGLDGEVKRLQGMLAECYRLTGADPDGNEDWRLAEYAVQAVQNQRSYCNQIDEELEEAYAHIAVLERDHA